jgi:superfamily II DNA or RNA helicase
MIVEEYNNRLVLKDVSPAVANYLNNKMSVNFTSWYRDRNGCLQRKVRQFCFAENFTKYPIGLKSRILSALDEKNVVYSLLDKKVLADRQQVSEIIIVGLKEKIRDYQRNAVRACYAKGNGIVASPTGSGKTFIMAALIASFRVQTLIIVPNLELVRQTYDVMVGFFGKKVCGMIGGGQFKIGSLVTVSTIQSLWSKFKLTGIPANILTCGAVFLDESHHAALSNTGLSGNTFYKIISRIPARYRFGFTATPGEEGDPNRRLLEAVVGQVIFTIGAKELVDTGYLVKPQIRMHEYYHDMPYDSWEDSKKFGITNNVDRNKKIVDLAMQENEGESGRILIAIDRVEQGKNIINLLKLQTNSVELLIGEDSEEKRKRVLTDFKKGRIQILVSTLLNEGFDFTGLRCVINAPGGKSQKQTVQRLGRALRIDVASGKMFGVCIDFFDRVIETSNQALYNHSLSRRKSYKDLEFSVEMVKE